MPRIAREMRPAEIRNLKPKHANRPTPYNVGGIAGLIIQVQPSGAKSWILRITINGKRREIGLGAFPEILLADARDKARELREYVRQGGDPLADRRAIQERKMTFAEAMDKFLASKLSEFSNPKHAQQWQNTLATYAVPVLGDMPVRDIVVQDVLAVLEPIWLSKTETAKRVRGRIEAVLAWATVHGHRTGDNPARWAGNLDAVMPKPRPANGRQPAVPVDEMPEWFASLKKRKGMAARALEFLTLTAARSGEVLGMTWAEVDLAARVWTIPADRMKARQEHRVPLSGAAVAMISALPRNGPLVFPAVRGGQLSDMSLSAVMRRMPWLDPKTKRNAVPHGLRSSFRDWAAEKTDYPRDMAEMALAHTVSNAVEAAYRRGDMLERRRAMMDDWARYLKG